MLSILYSGIIFISMQDRHKKSRSFLLRTICGLPGLILEQPQYDLLGSNADCLLNPHVANFTRIHMWQIPHESTCGKFHTNPHVVKFEQTAGSINTNVRTGCTKARIHMWRISYNRTFGEFHTSAAFEIYIYRI